jgi:hypothetical protein
MGVKRLGQEWVGVGGSRVEAWRLLVQADADRPGHGGGTVFNLKPGYGRAWEEAWEGGVCKAGGWARVGWGGTWVERHSLGQQWVGCRGLPDGVGMGMV